MRADYRFWQSFLRKGGCTGFIGTDTVSEGDSRVSGPVFLLRNGFTVYRAVKRQQWPGEAAVKICQFHLFSGEWHGSILLDGKQVDQIDSAFDAGQQGDEPKPLLSSQAISFTGTKVYGNGFVLSIEEGTQLIRSNEKNRQVVKPYLVGRELNDTACSPGRYIIDFTGMTRSQAESFIEPWAIVENRVREDRQSAPEKAMREQFWLFQRPRKELYALLKERGSAWLIAATSDTVAFVAVEYSDETPVIFSHAVNVLALHGYDQFAVAQSSIHLSWARRYGSSMKGDMRYTTTDCFENFPFPADCGTLANPGEDYYRFRNRLAQVHRIGLTDLYQLMHCDSEMSEDIRALRKHQAQMDSAVAAAYGWTDLNLDHGFHETKQGIRYTISEAARREVLARLLTLNHERYADEVKRGLHDSKKKPKPAPKPKATRASKPKPAAAEAALFGTDEVDPAIRLTKRDETLCGLLCDLVAAEPSLRFDAYSDALMIAVQPKLYEGMLPKEERTPFIKLAESLKVSGGDASLPWGNIRDTLLDNAAIEVSSTTSFIQGSRFAEVRPDYPECDPKVVDVIRKVAAALRELQNLGQSAPADGQRVLSEHEETKRAKTGAAS